MAMYKKEEAICLELGDKDGLSRSCGNQAMILMQLGNLHEAQELLEKAEAICVELQARSGLAMICWQWAWVARAHGDHQTERQKLQQALALFTELKMPRERDAVQAELDKTSG